MRGIFLAGIAVVAGCGSSATPGPVDETKQETAPSGPPLAQQAQAFVEAPATDTADRVRWEISTMAVALVGLNEASQMPIESLTEGEDPVEEMIGTLARADIAAEAKRNRAEFLKRWKGTHDCIAKPMSPGALHDLSDEIVARLPKWLQKAAHEIKAGTTFTVDCKEATAVVVMSPTGEVLAMEPPRERSAFELWLGPSADPEPIDDEALKKLIEENRFEGYLNQPAEVPEE